MKEIRLVLTPALLVTALIGGIAYAQGTETKPQNKPATPPTPLPTKKTDTTPFKVTEKDVKPVTIFDKIPPGQPLATDPPAIRSLDEAIQIALQRSPTVLQATERAVKTKNTIDQILGGTGPQVSVSVTGSRLFNAQSGAGSATGGSLSSIQNPFSTALTTTPPGTTPVQLSNANTGNVNAVQTGTTTGTTTRAASTSSDSDGKERTRQQTPSQNTTARTPELTQGSATVSVTQLIDITGVVRTADQIGDLEQALTRLELARVRQETALTVKNGYYAVLRAQAFVKVNEAAVAQSEEQLRVTTVQKNAGVAAEFDVLRAKTQLDNNRQALISSRHQVIIAQNSFANSLGIDPATPVELAETTEVPPAPDLTEEPLITKALAQRPEYFQADTNILKAQKNVRLAHRGLEPFMTAGVSASYSISEPTAINGERTTGRLTLGLTVPLWDGGTTREVVKAAQSDERNAKVQKDQYVRGIKAEVQQSIIAVQDALERTSVTEGTVTQAREALRLANVRFRAGVGTQLEVNDAQTALTQAETNFVNARYDYLASLARLSRAVGDPV